MDFKYWNRSIYPKFGGRQVLETVLNLFYSRWLPLVLQGCLHPQRQWGGHPAFQLVVVPRVGRTAAQTLYHSLFFLPLHLGSSHSRSLQHEV